MRFRETALGASALLAMASLTVSRNAFAYRPFDGTDADVAELGLFEAEVGTAFSRKQDRTFLAAPVTVLNLGILKGVEAVADFTPLFELEPAAGQPRFHLIDTDVLVKWVFCRGSLQGEDGLSLALETGPLLPEINGVPRFGYQADVIASERWRFFAAHLNAIGELSRLGNPGGFGSLILEGVPAATVRPVAELLAGGVRNEGATYSGLAGAIWTVSQALAVDAAVRVASEAKRGVIELRVGVTGATPVWTEPPP